MIGQLLRDKMRAESSPYVPPPKLTASQLRATFPKRMTPEAEAIVAAEIRRMVESGELLPDDTKGV